MTLRETPDGRLDAVALTADAAVVGATMRLELVGEADSVTAELTLEADPLGAAGSADLGRLVDVISVLGKHFALVAAIADA